MPKAKQVTNGEAPVQSRAAWSHALRWSRITARAASTEEEEEALSGKGKRWDSEPGLRGSGPSAPPSTNSHLQWMPLVQKLAF